MSYNVKKTSGPKVYDTRCKGVNKKLFEFFLFESYVSCSLVHDNDKEIKFS